MADSKPVVDKDQAPTYSRKDPFKDSVRKDLNEQAEAVKKMKPKLSVLAQLYNERKSTIDQIVMRYANKRWWEKLIMGGVVFSSSYLVGAFMGAALALSILITCLYVIATSLMEDHAEIMRKRDKLFLVEIQELEASIEERINAFRLLETQLKKVFESLNAIHAQRSEGISTFESNVNTVESHNQRYASVIDSLKNAAEKLSKHEGDTALNEAEIERLYSELKSTLNESEALASTLSGLVSTVEQELKKSTKPEVESNQDGVDSSPIAVQVEADFGAIDRELEALFKLSSEAGGSSNESDDEFGDIDQEIAKLRKKSTGVTSTKMSQDGVSIFSSAMHNVF